MSLVPGPRARFRHRRAPHQGTHRRGTHRQGLRGRPRSLLSVGNVIRWGLSGVMLTREHTSEVDLRQGSLEHLLLAFLFLDLLVSRHGRGVHGRVGGRGSREVPEDCASGRVGVGLRSSLLVLQHWRESNRGRSSLGGRPRWRRVPDHWWARRRRVGRLLAASQLPSDVERNPGGSRDLRPDLGRLGCTEPAQGRRGGHLRRWLGQCGGQYGGGRTSSAACSGSCDSFASGLLSAEAESPSTISPSSGVA